MFPMVGTVGPGNKLALEALYGHAVRLLGRRLHTYEELKRKLLRRSARDQDVATVLKRLTEYGYLDDKSVAESYSSYRREVEVLGRRRVLNDLSRRGVDPATAEKAVSEVYCESDEHELAREHLQRKFGQRLEEFKIKNQKELARLYRTLIRAGFSASVIVDLLVEISPQSDWVESFADSALQESYEE